MTGFIVVPLRKRYVAQLILFYIRKSMQFIISYMKETVKMTARELLFREYYFEAKFNSKIKLINISNRSFVWVDGDMDNMYLTETFMCTG